MKRTPLGVAAATKCLFATWFLAISLAAFGTISSASAAIDAHTSVEGLNAAEEWVVERVTAGAEANLSTALDADHAKRFPKEDDRKISANFLQELLMGTLPNLKTHRHGVQIKGAHIEEPIDLENAQIPYEVRLEYFHFNARATFAGANFAANASFQGSTFKTEAKFSHMKVGGDAAFDAVVFQGPVSFKGADIAGDFQARGNNV